MENNSVTPTPAPTPAPVNSMPQFASAPETPAPVIPPATSMPSFGAPAEQAQPVAPAPQPAAPVEAPATTEAQPAAPETPASMLGEISNETAPASTISIEPTPQPATTEAQPAAPVNSVAQAEPVIQNPAGPTIPATPAPAVPEKKKMNTKLVAIAGGAVVLIVAVIIGIVALTGQPKTTNNPASAPVITVNTPDNSTPFAELDKDGALDFLTAVGKTDSYFPEDFIDETDSDILPTEGEKDTKLAASYETKDQAKTIVFNSMDQTFKSKYADKNLGTSEKVDYTVVYVDQETAECNDCSRYVTFSNKVINHTTQNVVNPTTGALVPISTITFVKNTEENAKRYLPVIFYANEKVILYSSEVKTLDAGYQFIANVIYLGLDEAKMATAEAGTVPRAINLATITYTVDKTTGNLLIAKEMSAANQLKPVKSFSVTDEEVADLI